MGRIQVWEKGIEPDRHCVSWYWYGSRGIQKSSHSVFLRTSLVGMERSGLDHQMEGNFMFFIVLGRENVSSKSAACHTYENWHESTWRNNTKFPDIWCSDWRNSRTCRYLVHKSTRPEYQVWHRWRYKTIQTIDVVSLTLLPQVGAERIFWLSCKPVHKGILGFEIRLCILWRDAEQSIGLAMNWWECTAVLHVSNEAAITTLFIHVVLSHVQIQDFLYMRVLLIFFSV